MRSPRDRIVDSWVRAIRRAIEVGNADAAYRITVGLYRRMVERGWL